MSKRKPKPATIWFRFKFEDTDLNRMRVQQAADKLFRLPAMIDRRQYTTEDVLAMVKAAIRYTRAHGQMIYSSADLEAIRADGATIEITSTNTDTTPPRVRITWPESTGYLYDTQEEDAQ